jgi:RHS repeat-associated protein
MRQYSIIAKFSKHPFGMAENGRKFTQGSKNYRYNFNGKEQDKETSLASTYDYGFRIYNPALGRFLSVDPLTQSYPWNSPYAFAENEPIANIDIDGLEKKKKTFFYAEDKGTVVKKVKEPEIQVVDPNAKPSIEYHLNYGGSNYILNSETTIQGRGPQVKTEKENPRKEGDFTGVRTVTDEELGYLIAFTSEVIRQADYTLLPVLRTAADETVNKSENNNYGLLDFKIVAYKLLSVGTDNLLNINGVLYNPNEAGNYIWALGLEYNGISVSAPDQADAFIQKTQGHHQDAGENKAAKKGELDGGIIAGTAGISGITKTIDPDGHVPKIEKAIQNNATKAKTDVDNLKKERKANPTLRDENITH